MEKTSKLLYWIFLGAIVFYISYMVIVLALSPKNDDSNRGFVGCTKELVLRIGNCERGKMLCVLSAIWNDTTCNAQIINKGFASWVVRKQQTPWDNYLYAQKTTDILDYPEYQSDPKADMQILKKHRELMEKSMEVLDNAKMKNLKIDTDVLQSDSEDEASKAQNFAAPQEILPDEKQDISDETNAVMNITERKDNE